MSISSNNNNLQENIMKNYNLFLKETTEKYFKDFKDKSKLHKKFSKEIKKNSLEIIKAEDENISLAFIKNKILCERYIDNLSVYFYRQGIADGNKFASEINIDAFKDLLNPDDFKTLLNDDEMKRTLEFYKE